MATVTDSTAAALDALHAAVRAELPEPPTGGADDGVGVAVDIGPDDERTARPRVLTIAAAFNSELDPLAVVRAETGAGPSYADTITVVCSLLVQASEQHPERDFPEFRQQASAMLAGLGSALQAPALRQVAARARLLAARWYDAYDGVGGGPAAVVVDAQIELTVLS